MFCRFIFRIMSIILVVSFIEQVSADDRVCISFIHEQYQISEENDDWIFGDGVDLYHTWIIQNPVVEAGYTVRREDQTVGRCRDYHFGEHIFEVTGNPGDIFSITLSMVEGDDTSDRVRRGIEAVPSTGVVPSLRNIALDGVLDYWLIHEILTDKYWRLAERGFTLISNLVNQGGWDTDDDYGLWILLVQITSDGDSVRVMPVHMAATCDLELIWRDIWGTGLVYFLLENDGCGFPIGDPGYIGLRFVDEGNYIVSMIMVTASNFNLFSVASSNTGSGMTEVHVLSAASDYADFNQHTETCLELNDSDWEYLLDADQNLYAIQKNGTTSGRTELSRLSAADGYSTFIQSAVATGLGTTDASWNFLLAPDGDLFAIHDPISQNIGVHVLSEESSYQDFILQVATELGSPEGWGRDNEYLLAPNRDLFIVKGFEWGTASPDLCIVSAESNYSEYELISTPLGVKLLDWDYVLAPNRDLYAIRKQNPDDPTAMTEVHVLSAESNYQEYILKVVSGLHQTDDSWTFLM